MSNDEKQLCSLTLMRQMQNELMQASWLTVGPGGDMANEESKRAYQTSLRDKYATLLLELWEKN